MAGAKELRANIVVGGRADSSFVALGNQLTALGGLLDPISRKLIDFGKESVKAYTSYEDAMLDAQVALRSQYNSAGELSRVMQKLDESALQWANDSRFTTEDVAGAISKAAHAGWDLEKMLTGVPSAMKLSLAGGMELSQGLEYMVDITNAAGLNFKDLGDMVDYWTYAANRSSTTVPEMGEAMQKMGATLQFAKGDTAALTTMLSVLADNGTKGTAAGTLLRNTMLRLIAPTKAAASAMDELNLTADELEDIYSDSSGLEDAVNFLKDAGFSAYDAQGNLKSFLDIFEELNAATKGLTDQERNDILSNIFPTRTITGALALIKAADEEWNGLYEDVQMAGRGYADYAAQTMESGIGGALRHLNSVYNTLQTKTGDALAAPVEDSAQAISWLIEAVNGMNPTAFNALVSGLGSMAVGTQALIGVGGFMKMMPLIKGILSSPAAWWAAGAAMLGTAAFGLNSVMKDLGETAAKAQWGSLGIDETSLSKWLSTEQAVFQKATQGIRDYTEQAEQAVESYKANTAELKESLMTASITGKMSAEDKDALREYGAQIEKTVADSIRSSNSGAQMALAMFGSGEFADEISENLRIGMELSVEKAGELGQKLRGAIENALKDGSIDAGDIFGIQKAIDELNDFTAMQNQYRSEATLARAMREAQSVGFEDMGRALGILQNAEDAAMSDLGESFELLYAQTAASNRMRMEKGAISAEEAKSNMDAVDAFYAQQADAIKSRTKNAEISTILESLQGTEIGGYLYGAAAAARAGGDALTPFSQYKSYGAYTRRALEKQVDGAIEAIGGFDTVQEALRIATEQGNATAASNAQALIDMISIAGGGNPALDALTDGITVPVDANADFSNVESEKEKLKEPVTFTVTGVYGGTSGKPGGGTIFGSIAGFAEGGRAAEPSIFGESGPEWAIPEEHTTRTAELLRSAAAASGFTWTDLLSIGSGSGGGNTLIYSPTIVAQDAKGVEEKLKADKLELEKYLKEKKWLDGIVKYQ